MSLPVNRPFKETCLTVQSTSIGASPVAAPIVSPVNGILERVTAGPAGTTTGTITVAVAINGGSDVTNGGLTIPAGTGARNNPSYELPLVGAGTVSGVYVNEGDVIVFTPSGGGGASIAGSFAVTIRHN